MRFTFLQRRRGNCSILIYTGPQSFANISTVGFGDLFAHKIEQDNETSSKFISLELIHLLVTAVISHLSKLWLNDKPHQMAYN